MVSRPQDAEPRCARPRARACAWAIALLLLVACQNGVNRAAAPPVDPVRVYVLDYGRHTSLVLPASDGRLVEWFWGDWNWYALNNRGLADGVTALFGSPAATLGQLDLGRPESADVIRGLAGASSITAIDVEHARVEALVAELSGRFERNRESEVLQSDGRRFVREGGAGYSLSNNSNHAVAGWLRQLQG